MPASFLDTPAGESSNRRLDHVFRSDLPTLGTGMNRPGSLTDFDLGWSLGDVAIVGDEFYVFDYRTQSIKKLNKYGAQVSEVSLGAKVESLASDGAGGWWALVNHPVEDPGITHPTAQRA